MDGSQKVCYVGMALSSSKFYHCMVYKSYATFHQWFLPRVEFTLDWDTIGPTTLKIDFVRRT